MKKIYNFAITFILILAIGSTSVFASFTDTLVNYSGDADIFQSLNDEQKKHYLYNHLSIETEENSKTSSYSDSYSYAPWLYSGNVGLGTALVLSAVGLAV